MVINRIPPNDDYSQVLHYMSCPPKVKVLSEQPREAGRESQRAGILPQEQGGEDGKEGKEEREERGNVSVVIIIMIVMVLYAILRQV